MHLIVNILIEIRRNNKSKKIIKIIKRENSNKNIIEIKVYLSKNI